MVTMASNTEYKSWLSSEDETIVALEKAQSGELHLKISLMLWMNIRGCTLQG